MGGRFLAFWFLLDPFSPWSLILPPTPIKGFQNYLTVRFKEAIPPSPNPSLSASQSNCQEINAWVVHGVFSSVKGKTFLILFISRNIWQGGEQIILVSKLRSFHCVFLWPHANPDFGESCQKERMGEEPRWSALLWSMILLSPRLTILLNAMSVIADEQNILLYQSYVMQGLQIQKKFHFALVPKLKFLFLHPNGTNLSFPHVETIFGFHDSATWELLCFVSTLPFSWNKYIAWVFLLWLFKYILSILKAPNLYLVSSRSNWCRCFWYRPSLVCTQNSNNSGFKGELKLKDPAATIKLSPCSQTNQQCQVLHAQCLACLVMWIQSS